MKRQIFSKKANSGCRFRVDYAFFNFTPISFRMSLFRINFLTIFFKQSFDDFCVLSLLLRDCCKYSMMMRIAGTVVISKI